MKKICGYFKLHFRRYIILKNRLKIRLIKAPGIPVFQLMDFFYCYFIVDILYATRYLLFRVGRYIKLSSVYMNIVLSHK